MAQCVEVEDAALVINVRDVCDFNVMSQHLCRVTVLSPLSGHNFASGIPAIGNATLTLDDTSQYGGSSSIRNARRFVCSQPINVDPLPPNRSSKFSPGLDEY